MYVSACTHQVTDFARTFDALIENCLMPLLNDVHLHPTLLSAHFNGLVHLKNSLFPSPIMQSFRIAMTVSSTYWCLISVIFPHQYRPSHWWANFSDKVSQTNFVTKSRPNKFPISDWTEISRKTAINRSFINCSPSVRVHCGKRGKNRRCSLFWGIFIQKELSFNSVAQGRIILSVIGLLWMWTATLDKQRKNPNSNLPSFLIHRYWLKYCKDLVCRIWPAGRSLLTTGMSAPPNSNPLRRRV